MRFQGSGRPLTAAGINAAAKRLGTGMAELWAVITVETAGFGFLADRRPRILFERSVFHDLTNNVYDSSHPDISGRERAGYRGGAAEYDRLASALALDEDDAIASTSWGLGQVMGFNATGVGYTRMDTMIAAMVAGEDLQLLAMARFIEYGEIVTALREHDWDHFAVRYNGLRYRDNDYAERLAAAYDRACRVTPDLDVRATQAALLYVGFDPGPIDGILGERTRAALREYQRRPPQPFKGLFTGAMTTIARQLPKAA